MDRDTDAICHAPDAKQSGDIARGSIHLPDMDVLSCGPVVGQVGSRTVVTATAAGPGAAVARPWGAGGAAGVARAHPATEKGEGGWPLSAVVPNHAQVRVVLEVGRVQDLPQGGKMVALGADASPVAVGSVGIRSVVPALCQVVSAQASGRGQGLVLSEAKGLVLCKTGACACLKRDSSSLRSSE